MTIFEIACFVDVVLHWTVLDSGIDASIDFSLIDRWVRNWRKYNSKLSANCTLSIVCLVFPPAVVPPFVDFNTIQVEPLCYLTCSVSVPRLSISQVLVLEHRFLLNGQASMVLLPHITVWRFRWWTFKGVLERGVVFQLVNSHRLLLRYS